MLLTPPHQATLNLRPGDRFGGGRFEVLRVLGFSETGGLYGVVDREDASSWTALEILPPADMPPAEVAGRILRLQIRVGRLSALGHPAVAAVRQMVHEGARLFVIVEQTGGADLAAELAGRSKWLPRRQALAWGMEVCDGLQAMYLACAAAPPDFVSPAHVRILEHRAVKLVNFGLRGYFFEPFDRSPENDMTLALRGVGRLLAFLVNGESGNEEDSFGSLSPELAWVVSRCLSADPRRNYSDFGQLQAALRPFLDPGTGLELLSEIRRREAAEATDAARKAEEETAVRIAGRARRRGRVAAVAAAAVLGCGVAGYAAVRGRTPPPRTESAVYAASGAELLQIRPRTGEILGRSSLGGVSAGMAVTSDGLRLFVAQPEEDRVLVIDTRANRPAGFIATEDRPQALVMGPGDRELYVMHADAGVVEIVTLDRSPPPAGAQDPLPRTRDRVTGILAGGTPPLTMAVGKAPSRVFLGSATDGQLQVIVPNPLELVVSTQARGAGPLALSPDGRVLYVAGARQVQFLDSETLRPLARPAASGGSRPLALLAPPGGALWCLNRLGGLGIVGTRTHRLETTLTLAGEPVAAAFTEASGEGRLWIALKAPDALAVVDPKRRALERYLPLDSPPDSLVVVPAPPSAR